MTKLKLVYYPEDLLREKTTPVVDFNEELHRLIDDMFETMEAESGLGLAAPQVGSNLRLTVMDVTEDRSKPLEFINPVIIEKTNKIDSEEGCLSIPGFRDVIKRAETIVVKAQNRNGEEFQLQADGLLARCIQHEVDHLDGVLFIDHLSRLKRQLFNKWLKKNLPFEDEEE